MLTQFLMSSPLMNGASKDIFTFFAHRNSWNRYVIYFISIYISHIVHLSLMALSFNVDLPFLIFTRFTCFISSVVFFLSFLFFVCYCLLSSLLFYLLLPRPCGLEEDIRQYEQDLAKRLYQSRVRASLGSAAAPPTSCSSSSCQPRSALNSRKASWGLSCDALHRFGCLVLVDIL